MALPKIKFVILDISVHFIITAVLSATVYLQTKNLLYIGLAVLGGIFIDLDHFVDHYLYHKKIFNIKDFFACEHIKSRKCYLIFHSWELIAFLLVMGLILKSGGLLILCLAMGLHLTCDTCWRKNKLTYFLAYRIANKFDARVLLREYN